MTRTRTRTGSRARIRTVAPEPFSYRKSTAREYFESIVIAVILALFVRTWVVQAFTIPTGSMEHNLLVGDYLLVNKFVFGPTLSGAERLLLPQGPVSRGDIIVFKFPRDPERDFIKRVIGLPGERLEVREGAVHIDGEPLDEPWAAPAGDGIGGRGGSNHPPRQPRTDRDSRRPLLHDGRQPGQLGGQPRLGAAAAGPYQGQGGGSLLVVRLRESGGPARAGDRPLRCGGSARWPRTSSPARAGIGCCGRCTEAAAGGNPRPLLDRRAGDSQRAGGVRRPKIAGPDAYHRSALRDGDLEVVAHAHGQLAEDGGGDPLVEQRVAQLPGAGESTDAPPPGLPSTAVSASGPVRGRPGTPRAASSIRRTSSAGAPCFVASPARSTLDEQVGRGLSLDGGLVEPAQQLHAVDGVDPGEAGRGAARLVRLQMADQVPPDAQPGGPLDLPERLLHAVLAEVGETGARGCFYGGQWERLGDGDEPDRSRIPPGGRRGAVEAVTNEPEIGRQRVRSRGAAQRSALQLGDARPGVCRVLAASIQAERAPQRGQCGS